MQQGPQWLSSYAGLYTLLTAESKEARIDRLLTRLVVVSALVLFGGTGGVSGEVIFDNYGGTHTWFPYGREVTGPLVQCDPRWEQAMQFTVPTGVDPGFVLESATFPVYLRYGGPCPMAPNTTLSVTVYSDVGGVSGVPLESAQVTAAKRGKPEEVTATFTGAVVVQHGISYWLVLTGNGDSDHGWLKPVPAVVTGSGTYRELGGIWKSANDDDLAFKMEGTKQVPVEPQTWGRIKALCGLDGRSVTRE